MAEVLKMFQDQAQKMIEQINDKGGLRGMVDGLRNRLEEADRKRDMNRVKVELERLDAQYADLTRAIGLEAVSLYERNMLKTPELEPLCQHVSDIHKMLEAKKQELTQLEADAAAEQAARAAQTRAQCSVCGNPLPETGAFCAYCGAPIHGRAVTSPAQPLHCPVCDAEIRPGAKFCARCGADVSTSA